MVRSAGYQRLEARMNLRKVWKRDAAQVRYVPHLIFVSCCLINDHLCAFNNYGYDMALGSTYHVMRSVPIENVYSIVTFFLVANKHRQAIAGTVSLFEAEFLTTFSAQCRTPSYSRWTYRWDKPWWENSRKHFTIPVNLSFQPVAVRLQHVHNLRVEQLRWDLFLLNFS